MTLILPAEKQDEEHRRIQPGPSYEQKIQSEGTNTGHENKQVYKMFLCGHSVILARKKNLSMLQQHEKKKCITLVTTSLQRVKGLSHREHFSLKSRSLTSWM